MLEGSSEIKRDNLFKPIKSTRSSEHVANEIRKSIINGDIKPGQSLPSERTLAENFNVTRNTVREALRSLEQHRLVSVRQGARITVQDYLTTAGFEFVSELLLSTGKENGELMIDIAGAWSSIGRAMMQYTIDHVGNHSIGAMEEAIKALAKEAAKSDCDLHTLQELDSEVHATLIRATGNQVMILLHNSIRFIYKQVVTLFEPIMKNPNQILLIYRKMLDCLKKGDISGAKEQVDLYFNLGQDALMHTNGK